jgi:uncharacterized membrane protein YeaQ/YmgE (transglycosylase-associated protein family)
MMHFISFIILGLLAGLIAQKVMRQPHGWFMSLIIGVVGAWIGGFITDMLRIPAIGTGLTHWLLDVVVAAAGAILLLYVVGLIRKRPSAA